jgi:hypothetical protein
MPHEIMTNLLPHFSEPECANDRGCACPRRRHCFARSVQAAAERALPLLLLRSSAIAPSTRRSGEDAPTAAVFFTLDILCGIRGWQFDEPSGAITVTAGNGLLQLRAAVRACGDAILGADFSVASASSDTTASDRRAPLAGAPGPITTVEGLIDEVERQATRVTMRHSAYADDLGAYKDSLGDNAVEGEDALGADLRIRLVHDGRPVGLFPRTLVCIRAEPVWDGPMADGGLRITLQDSEAPHHRAAAGCATEGVTAVCAIQHTEDFLQWAREAYGIAERVARLLHARGESSGTGNRFTVRRATPAESRSGLGIALEFPGTQRVVSAVLLLSQTAAPDGDGAAATAVLLCQLFDEGAGGSLLGSARCCGGVGFGRGASVPVEEECATAIERLAVYGGEGRPF